MMFVVLCGEEGLVGIASRARGKKAIRAEFEVLRHRTTNRFSFVPDRDGDADLFAIAPALFCRNTRQPQRVTGP